MTLVAVGIILVKNALAPSAPRRLHLLRHRALELLAGERPRLGGALGVVLARRDFDLSFFCCVCWYVSIESDTRRSWLMSGTPPSDTRREFLRSVVLPAVFSEWFISS